MADLRLSDLHIPPGYRVTIHLGEKPERAFPERPRAFGPPAPDGYLVPDADEASKIPEPTARIDIFRHGRAISSAVIRQEDLDTIAELLAMVLDETGRDPAEESKPETKVFQFPKRD